MCLWLSFLDGLASCVVPVFVLLLLSVGLLRFLVVIVLILIIIIVVTLIVVIASLIVVIVIIIIIIVGVALVVIVRSSRILIVIILLATIVIPILIIVSLIIPLIILLLFWLLRFCIAADIVLIRESIIFEDRLRCLVWLCSLTIELIHRESLINNWLHFNLLLFSAVVLLQIKAVILNGSLLVLLILSLLFGAVVILEVETIICECF